MPNSATQEALGRLLTELGRIPGLGERIVTVAPDVAVSTNLGGWINKAGVYAAAKRCPTTRPKARACCAGSPARPASTSSSASPR